MTTFRNCDTVMKWEELAIGGICSSWNLSSKADKPNLAIHNAFETLGLDISQACSQLLECQVRACAVLSSNAWVYTSSKTQTKNQTCPIASTFFS